MPAPSARHTAASPEAPPAASDVLDLSVVIVNYNVREFLEQALRSVERAARGLRVEVFVVDNNSVDGSVEMVRTQFPDVHLIANTGNVGFSRANNQAIRRARGRHLLILNPDTIVQEDTFAALLRFMDEHPEAGAAGCQILNPDGTFAPESRRAFPRPTVAFYRIAGLSRLFPRSPTFGRYNMTYLPQDAVAEVDALSGSCMLVRHAALYRDADAPDAATPLPTPTDDQGAGLFDEDFFMYGEDLDWCFRIQQAGWKIYYTPSTQIIHYKGESTKKGELRYVRLFYGAMLRFTEKHFQNRYSRVFAGLLRLGIVARAGMTVLGNTARRLAPTLLDLLLVFAVVSVLGGLHAWQLGVAPSPLFFGAVAPAYALGTVAGLALAGGTVAIAAATSAPVWTGALLGLLLVAAASFFVKDIAFSRAVVLLSFPLTGLLLAGRRLLHRPDRRGERGTRTGVFVGPRDEACRLQQLLARHPHPPFALLGYVADAPDAGLPPAPDERLPRLGAQPQLRDLVRLRRLDDVVFAADGLSTQTIFGLIQQLRDLPVHFLMLAEGREHLIGKASIDDLSIAPFVEPEEARFPVRSPWARRAFAWPVALLGLLLHPLAALLGRRREGWRRLAQRTRQLPGVFTGRLTLVGYHPDEPYRPPEAWGLQPGIFTITDTLQTPHPTREELSRAYWFYLRNQSASMDWDILVRSLRTLLLPPDSTDRQPA